MISKYNPPLPPYPPPPLPRQPPLPGTPPLPLSSPLMLPLLLQTPQNTYFPSFQAQKVETRHDQFSQSIKTPYFETRSFEPIDKRIVYQSMHRNATPESSNYCFIEPRKTLYEAVCDAWGSVELCMDANAPIWTAADEEISSTESPTSSSSSHTWNDSINAQFDSLWVEEFFNDVNDTKFQLSENLSNQGTCEETDEEIEAEISESISNSGTKMSARRFYALPVNSLFPSLCSQSASKLRASARHFQPFAKTDSELDITHRKDTSSLIVENNFKIAPHMEWWPGDWKCSVCGNHNFSYRDRCKRCKLGTSGNASFAYTDDPNASKYASTVPVPIARLV